MTEQNRIWNPTAKNCSKCTNLETMIDKKSGTEILGQKHCKKFGWEIDNNLAKTQAACKIELSRRKRRKKK